MPLLTLTTDIGQQDYLIAAVKGQLLSLDASFTIVDVTHHLQQSNFPHAAYICTNAFKHFPAGTIHIILVNVFELPPTQLLITRFNGQYIVCADNGLITMITGEQTKEVFAVTVDPSYNFLQLTQTIADAVHHIAQGKEVLQVAPVATAFVEKAMLYPTMGNDWIEGQILFVDNFENVVINITQQEFEAQRKGRSFKIVFKRNEVIDTISSNYAAVHEGEKVAIFNAAGYLELAINKGNMAGLFGLQGFNEKMHQSASAPQNKWFYQTVRIFFE